MSVQRAVAPARIWATLRHQFRSGRRACGRKPAVPGLHFLVHPGVVGVGGHVEHADVRTQEAHGLGQIASVQIRAHADVREQQIDGKGMVLVHEQGILAAAAEYDRVPFHVKDGLGQLHDGFLVIDHQDCFCSFHEDGSSDSELPLYAWTGGRFQ